MTLAVGLLEGVGMAVGAYVAGLLVITPGLVIGKMMERRDVPQWPNHVAILVVGAVTLAMVFYGRGDW